MGSVKALSIRQLLQLLAPAVNNFRVDIVRIIAVGSYGVVLLGKGALTGKSYIVKVSRLAPGGAASCQGSYRLPRMNGKPTSAVWHCMTPQDFSRGVQAQRALNQCAHVCTARVLRAGTVVTHSDHRQETLGVCIMSRLRGLTLHALLTGGQCDGPQCSVLAARCGKALASLHAGGIVHGDFHSNNIIIGAGLQPALLDFDRTCNSRILQHRLHDVAMFMDSVPAQVWQAFWDAYCGVRGASNPLTGSAAQQTQTTVHAHSSVLFKQYIAHLNSLHHHQTGQASTEARRRS